MRRTLPRRTATLLAAVPLVLALTACGHGTDRRSIAATFVGNGAGFTPLEITGDKEDTMVLQVGNGTNAEHGFSIQGYRIRRVVQPNETLQVRFRLSRAGTFRIFCQLHETHQTATLIVR